MAAITIVLSHPELNENDLSDLASIIFDAADADGVLEGARQQGELTWHFTR